ncbi:hypothetical protein [Paenibacillus lemnae]|uniref:Uncharacterized protein n=1 Tax=Paenibacillus lemnae TaxID=1330551 RepID=A0A848M875_PAELE|nr:hypothetical protein [Paenibacillus lemnae]NMO96816.1 hypothetical protein [Paenibacillus lemnae]
MDKKKTDHEDRFPGVDPIPEPDRQDHASTDMLDDVVTGILENKDDEKLKQKHNPSNENVDRSPGNLPDEK